MITGVFLQTHFDTAEDFHCYAAPDDEGAI